MMDRLNCLSFDDLHNVQFTGSAAAVEEGFRGIQKAARRLDFYSFRRGFTEENMLVLRITRLGGIRTLQDCQLFQPLT